MIKYNLSLLAHAQLSVPLTDSGTSLQVMPGQGAEFTQPPAMGILARSRTYTDLRNSEHVRLIGRSTDVIEIVRGIDGAQQAWPEGTLLLGYWAPELLNIVYSNMDGLEHLLNVTVGAGKQNVVFKRTGKDFVATAGAGLNVNVSSGSAFANYKLVSVPGATVFSFTAPIGDTRIDLIQGNALTNKIEIKTGVVGGGTPSVDADCIALWEVTTVPDQTTRIPGDLADVRTY